MPPDSRPVTASDNEFLIIRREYHCYIHIIKDWGFSLYEPGQVKSDVGNGKVLRDKARTRGLRFSSATL